jgi:hypothetical protein
MAHPAAAIDQVGETRRPPPIEIFRERCDARAMLVANGLMSLQDAVDGMQESAAAQGLVATHGQDRVQEIMAAAFAPVRRLDDG